MCVIRLLDETLRPTSRYGGVIASLDVKADELGGCGLAIVEDPVIGDVIGAYRV